MHGKRKKKIIGPHLRCFCRDIHYVIVELESAIIRELEQHVLEHSGLLLQLANVLAELDWFVRTA